MRCARRSRSWTRPARRRELPLWCMMETPRAMLRAEEIAAAHPRVGCLVMGTSDLAKDLHAAHTPERLPMITALGLCLLAARACGLAILDGVHLDLEDDEGFAAACRQGAELGFDGKTLIHPKQIAPGERGLRARRRGHRPGAPDHRGARAGGARGQGRGRGRRPAGREPARHRGAPPGPARRSDRGARAADTRASKVADAWRRCTCPPGLAARRARARVGPRSRCRRLSGRAAG